MGGLQNYFSLISIMFPLGVVLVFWNKFDKIWTAIEALTTKEFADETFQRQDVADLCAVEAKCFKIL